MGRGEHVNVSYSFSSFLKEDCSLLLSHKLSHFPSFCVPRLSGETGNLAKALRGFIGDKREPPPSWKMEGVSLSGEALFPLVDPEDQE
jgi:hypothetical protein